MIDLMRGVHTAYAPASEPFGTRLETFFIGLCVTLGHMDGEPFSVAKITAYMRVPRSTVIRRLDRLQRWGLIYRQGRRYYLHDRALNSFIGVRSYQTSRRLLSKATYVVKAISQLRFLTQRKPPVRFLAAGPQTLGGCVRAPSRLLNLPKQIKELFELLLVHS